MGYLEYFIGAIIFIVVIYTISHVIKRQKYRELDKLEATKTALMNRPVQEQMSKIKNLHMGGQVEEMFEAWRKSWDEVITVLVPKIDEHLLQAEKAIDQYRFREMKELKVEVTRLLEQGNKQVDRILNELKDLIGSEEKNRLEIAALTTEYKEQQKKLITERHHFGASAKLFDQKLSEIGHLFQQFEDISEQGNYLEAREIVLEITKEIKDLNDKMTKVPELLTEVKTIIPTQLKELLEGYHEMKGQGFYLEHIDVKQEVEQTTEKLQTYVTLLEKAESDGVQEHVEEIKEKIELLYDLLEREVHARNYLLENEEKTENLLLNIRQIKNKLDKEIIDVKQSYQLLHKDLDAQKIFEKQLIQLMKRFDILTANIPRGQVAYSVLKDELEEIHEKLLNMKEKQTSFLAQLEMLRKDELEAREKVVVLKRKIAESTRLVLTHHVPGVPSTYESYFKLAEESIENVIDSLDEKPLNMKQVQRNLQRAEEQVEQLTEQLEILIEKIALTERIIQYANRYRSSNESVASSLKASEKSFRNFDYERAFQEAVAAVEEVEPGALRKIEKMLEEESEGTTQKS